MTYPFTDTWAPFHDVVFLLAATVVILGLTGLVRLVRTVREDRRERSRWEQFVDRLARETAELYRDDPLGGRTHRWDGDRR